MAIYEECQHFGLYLDALANDFQRYQACRAKAEGLRNRWFEGQRREVNKIIDAAMTGDRMYRNMNKGELTATGETIWAKALESRDLAGAEQMYHRWAYGYLQAWQARSPGTISLLGSGLPGSLPTPG